MTITTDEAFAALVAEAETHEKEHGADFCDDARVKLVVYLMLRLELGLIHLGDIAEGYVDAIAAMPDDEDALDATEVSDGE